MKKGKRFSAILLVLVMGITTICNVPVWAAGNNGGYQPLTGIQSRTEDEIKNFLKDNPFSTTKNITYKITPNKNSFQAGELSEESVQDGLNALNFMRFIAGLDSNVISDAVYQTQAQAGTVLLDFIGQGLNHQPQQPSTVPNAFYQLGYQGTSQSNLGLGYHNISDSIINGYMYDGDANNIAAVGHRLWCLNPKMKKTGFGFSSNYTAMYSFDGGGSRTHANSIWPGSVMPYEYFKGPWHINFYDDNYLTTDASTISMKGLTSGKTCVLDKSYNDVNGKYFHSAAGSSLIIFQPDVEFLPNEEVEIIINGLADKAGQRSDISVRYTTKFFSIN